jgi:protein-S-isoprenylcysteine O-methyltransferase Ste14
VMRLRNPGLLRERLKPDRPEKGWDRRFLVLGSIATIGIFVVAVVDFFKLQGPKVPDWLAYAGAIPFLAGAIFIAWVMGENPFLERMVRIQHERSQFVITTGPYAIVRHPMYLGMIISSLGWPFVLGSYWAAIPVLLLDASFVFRTFCEDRTLHEELPGYQEYAQKTKYRLLPGVW